MYASQIQEEAKSWVSNCHIITLTLLTRKEGESLTEYPVDLVIDLEHGFISRVLSSCCAFYFLIQILETELCSCVHLFCFYLYVFGYFPVFIFSPL